MHRRALEKALFAPADKTNAVVERTSQDVCRHAQGRSFEVTVYFACSTSAALEDVSGRPMF